MLVRRTAIACFLGGLLVGMSPGAHAATVNSISTLGLLEGSYQQPAGVLTAASIKNLSDSAPVNNRSVTSARNSAQSFVVAADDFPAGIRMTGFVINYNSSTEGLSFGVQLFAVDDPHAATLVPDTPLLSNPSTGEGSLAFAESGVGTAMFYFDSPVTLAPGAYVWQFLPSTTTSIFLWERKTSNPYPLGSRYEAGAGSDPADFHFGIIGEALSNGDFDGDGDVDGADFVVWQTNFPSTSGATAADADGDEDVDGADFAIWQNAFPSGGVPGATSVPEPMPAELLGTAAIMLLAVRRKLFGFETTRTASRVVQLV